MIFHFKFLCFFVCFFVLLFFGNVVMLTFLQKYHKKTKKNKKFICVIDVICDDLPKSLITENGWSKYVHWYYSLSKYFCLTETKSALLYTENTQVLSSMTDLWLYYHSQTLIQQYIYNFLKIIHLLISLF